MSDALNATAPSTVGDLDFSACEAERIDAPGAIQDHGRLVAIDPVSLTAIAISKPPRELAAAAADLIGGDIAAVAAWLGEATPDALTAALEDLRSRMKSGRVQPVTFRTLPHATIILSAGIDCLLVEYREEPKKGGLDPQTVAAVLAGLKLDLGVASGTIFSLAEATATAIGTLTGFDRVMVYRFAEDWHGEVIAEARAKDMIPYLGLHYPATDIPARARQLYLENRVREIADTASHPIPLVPDAHAEAARPIDLSTAILRSISPYHLEYMANMGIRGTLVSSLVVDGKLWGLIACHHRAPIVTPWAVRKAFEDATIALSTALDRHLTEEREHSARQAARIGEKLLRFAQAPQPNLKSFLDGYMTATKSDGVMLVVGQSALALGNTPPANRLADLARAVIASRPDGAVPFAVLTDSLPTLWPEGERYAEIAAGVAAVAIAAEPPIVLAAFRPEWEREISWGGDPSRPAELDAKTGRLSPRRSFDVWRQTTRLHSRPWAPDTHALLAHLAANPALNGFFQASQGQISALRGVLGQPDVLHSAILNVALDGMLLTAATDTAGRIVISSINQEFENQFNLGPADIEDRTLDDVCKHLGIRSFSGLLAGQCCETQAWSPEFGRRTVRIHRRNVLDSSIDGDRVLWSVFIVQDITESRRNEEALIVARDRALAESRAKSEFLANMSHELRTPLNAILGYAELIESGLFKDGPPGKIEEGARSISTAGHRLLTLIEDLLELSRLDAGRRELREGRIDLTEIVAEAIDWCSRDVGFKEISFAFHAPDGALPFLGDGDAISRIAINLINNAAKFSDPGATVTVTLCLRADGCPLLTVSDQGPGIGPDLIDALFQPFVQGEKTYARRHGGAGLGLAISKYLVELHGGSIRLNSSLGEGTQAIVQLPKDRLLAETDPARR